MSQLTKKLIKEIFNVFFILIISLFCISLQVRAEKQGEFISIEEIKPGMKGVGKTVFAGTKIEDFEVEVIDIIQGNKITFPYILVKLSGDKINNNVGISAGMSGSPVFFNGKLAGAISHAWEMSEHNLCLITPIDFMLNLFDYVDKEEQYLYLPYLNNDKNVSVSLDENLKNKLTNLDTSLDKLNLVPSNHIDSNINFSYIQSPILISGFNGRALDFVRRSLKEQGITLVHSISDYQKITTELEIGAKTDQIMPGSAIGIQLSTGDISMMGIGTATYSQYNYVLALGHPFLHSGDASYLFTSVYIYHSFPSIVMPFKVGSSYRLLGEVIQDRSSGVLARLNRFPRIISCKIEVNDKSRNLITQSGAKIVPQKEIVQSLVPSLLIQSIDSAIDRIGQGTASIKFGFRRATDGQMIYYDNTFFSENDIAVEISKDLTNLFDLLYNNFYEKIDLNEIVLDVAIKDDNQRALIKEVKLDNKEFLPGDNIEAQIVITPFRKPAREEIIQIKLPDNITAQNAVLIVRGGTYEGKISENPLEKQDNEQYLLNGWTGIEKYLKEMEKNNQIIAEVVLINENERSETISRSLTEEQEPIKNLKIIVDTDFVIDGYHEIFFKIKNKNDNKVE